MVPENEEKLPVLIRITLQLLVAERVIDTQREKGLVIWRQRKSLRKNN